MPHFLSYLTPLEEEVEQEWTWGKEDVNVYRCTMSNSKLIPGGGGRGECVQVHCEQTIMRYCEEDP